MKRARPKNKKSSLKREIELRRQEMRESEAYEESEQMSDENTEDMPPSDSINKYQEIIEEIQHSRGNHSDESEQPRPRPRYDKPAVASNDTAKSRKSAPKKKKKKRSLLKMILTTIVAFIILVFVAMGCEIFDESDVLTPLENGKINVLMLGVDEEGLRTDAIMIASYDANLAQVNMLSVPRDTKVYVKNRDVTRKINEIHAMSSKDKNGEILGAEATAEAVSQLTGIPINYYVEFSFSAIDNLFDILGPVEFDVPDVEGKGRGMNYDDPVQNLHIHLKPGVQQLSGNQVQQFLRYRKSNNGGGSGSDTDRVARQQDFVKAVIDQKVNLALLLKLPDIYSQLSKEIKTNISVSDIIPRYVRYLIKLTGESIQTFSLPGDTKTISGGSYFVCNLEETKALISESFGYDAELTDKITLSETYSQKILKAGNVGKKSSSSPTPQPTKAPNASSAPKKTAAPEPTKAPVVTKEPIKAPAVTKEPLEDIYDDGEIEAN
ncbi:MAG: LCP family protein [Clostridiales bacterium]|nr:LCP family protein [Clostridiales bacterium]